MKKTAVHVDMAVGRIFVGSLIAFALSMGCSSQVASAPNGGLDGNGSNMMDQMSVTTGSSGGAASDTNATGPVACTTAQSWKANDDFAFDGSSATPSFRKTIGNFIAEGHLSPIAVSNTVANHCVWMVAFSAIDDVGAAESTAHAATFTEMFQHPTGLWTIAPQSVGFVRFVDAGQNEVWIPMRNLTGSATYGNSDCTALSKANVQAVIDETAGPLPVVTDHGTTTLGELLGPQDMPGGWSVRFSFSADLIQ